ncbi:MAG: S41 family peptidase [Thermodesulfobacteriota bacterium]
MAKPRIFAVAGLGAGIALLLLAWGQHDRIAAETQDVYKDLETFSNVLSIIQRSYVEEVDTREVVDGAIKGMLGALDPHSSFMTPDDFKELQMETKGRFTGIGIEITMKDGILTVVSPIEGTPAFKKGLKAGDRIMKIEKDFTKDMSLTEAVKRLRGPKGTEVTISVHREGWTELKEITIVRDEIPIHSVRSRNLEPGYLYVRVSNFQSETTRDLRKAVDTYAEKEAVQGMILDLRNNPGGLLDQAVKVSDLFLEDGLIVSTKGRIKDQNMTFKAHRGGDEYTFPMVVLVNEGTASASEIVAGALRDHKRALVLGAQTFGKGSVQTIIPMDDGSGLRLTTARYYTPNGTSIQAKGVVPDIIVPSTITYAKLDADKEKQREAWLVREKDLRRHIANGQGEEDEESAGEEPAVEEPNGDNDNSGEDQDAEFRKQLEKDPQLNTALLMLKGLHVLGNNP